MVSRGELFPCDTAEWANRFKSTAVILGSKMTYIQPVYFPLPWLRPRISRRDENAQATLLNTIAIRKKRDDLVAKYGHYPAGGHVLSFDIRCFVCGDV